MENVIHTFINYNQAANDLQVQAAAIDAWDQSTWKTYRHTGITLQEIKCKAMHSASAPMLDYVISPPRPGANGGVLLPLNTTFCLKLTTGLRGRSARGRLYYPGITQAMMATAWGDLQPTVAAALVTELQGLQSALLSGGYQLCIVSLRLNNAWRAQGAVTIVNNITYTDLHIDSQRRRLPGRGI